MRGDLPPRAEIETEENRQNTVRETRRLALPRCGLQFRSLGISGSNFDFWRCSINFVRWEFRASISLCGVAGFNFVCREFRASISCSGVVRSCIVIARGCGAEALNWACVCGARSPERKSACWSARRLACVCAGRERCPFHSRATWLAVAATALTKIMNKFCRKAVRNP